jgi:AcrR family transcriptional regulator
MSRPTTIRDEDILQAARAVFLERGLSAPTAEIAHRAGISEGSIFKRWPNKAALMHAALDVGDLAPTWLDQLEAAMVADPPAPVREVLIQVSTEALEFYRHMVPRMMMRWSAQSADERPEASFKPSCAQGSEEEPPPLRSLRVMRAYFALEAARGRLSVAEPEVPARMLGGSLFQYAAFEVMLRARKTEPLDASVFIEHLVDTLLNGIAVSPSAPPQASPRQPAGPRGGKAGS